MSKYQHVQNHNIFAAEQYGFRRGLSTTNATHWLNVVILNAGNNYRYISGCFCDLTIAFECVKHELLLKNLWFQRHTLRLG